MRFQKTVLPSGIRVVTESYADHRAAVAGAFVGVGTRDEPRGSEGLAHFIEHMVFKGTQRRSAYDLALALEAVGGELNAFTTREHTCFHTTSLKEDLALAIDVLGDLVSRAVFRKEDLELERQVILQEIAMSLEQVEDSIFDLYFKKALGRNPLGRAILGSNQTIAALTRKDLLSYYQSLYRGRNIVVCVAGNVVHEEVVEHVQRAFSSAPLRVNLKRRVRPQILPIREVVVRETEQAHILLGLPSVSFRDPLRFEAHIVNTLLGGGMTSLLYQDVREKKGLAYSIYSYLSAFTDTGLLLIYAGTDPKKVPDTIETCLRTLRQLKKRGVKKATLEMFKVQVRGNILLGADDLENRMNSLGVNEMIFGSYRSVDQVIEEINRINLESLHTYLESCLDFDKMGILTVGKLPGPALQEWLGGL